ncbi:hypothetical protein M3649_04210 [Ureibacillus chungkukjangi]|uniref:hypothetical protein n=1 Tax=Ureibacillus chungkukjangi TaxID=1202712 RepID=UPI00203B7362|nr:hypothetical protein [Ureibacillus chungkukjangi]MCM3387337.1 hypothetical protein [Ureibacillus chungkukjangi]
MTIYIKNLKDLEGMIKNKIANNLYFSSKIQDVMAEKMQEVIVDNVYAAHDGGYRRGNEDGFSDMDNMVFTNTEVSNNGVKFTFENITEGRDSMKGEEMAETFEKGIRENWVNPDYEDSKGRIVSDPRPFLSDTVDELNRSKSELTNALKKDLKNLGFDVK